MAVLAESPCPVTILNSPQGGGSWGQGGRSDTLAFLVGEKAGGAPSDLYTFLTFVGGSTETIDLGGGATVERVVPMRHPFLPDLLADSMRWRCTGYQIEGAPGWSDSIVEVEFVQPLFGTGGDAPYYTVRTRFGGEFATIPNAAMAFADGSRVTSDWGVFVPEIALSVTTYQSPEPVGSTIAGLLGKVNSEVFLGWGVGYVRFDGVESEFSKGTSGVVTYIKSFAITFRARPWNEVMKKTGVFEAPLNVTTGLPIYPSGDLRYLLY